MNQRISTRIRKLISAPDYRPLNKSEFARELSVSPKQRPQLREALNGLVEEGELKLGKKSRYYVPKREGKGETCRGTIRFSSRGNRRSAFFTPENPESVPALRKQQSDSLFVPSRATGTALDGDTVMVQVVKKQPRKYRQSRSRQPGNGRDPDSFEAHVVDVVERRSTIIVGVYERRRHDAWLYPEKETLPAFQLREALPTAKGGDIVVAEFVSWPRPDRSPFARMTEVLGKPDTPGVDMLKVIHQYQLPLEFPPEVLAEVETIGDEVTEADLERREDWRDREVFTIDPEDARDFDDAISVVEMENGEGWELAVHIADVSHYVKHGTALDREAKKRGNSVYLADRVIPMLPEKLSNGLCSLNPEVDRLTQVAVMRFDRKGKMTKARFAAAVINSCRRYTYEEALTRLKLEEGTPVFDDERENRLVIHLKRAWRLASLLRRRRFDAGCFDLDFPEVRVLLDDQGIAFGYRKSEHDESHQLIEEFMLAANEAVATETKKESAPSIYRIHEDPDPDKLDEFAELARTFGHKISDPTVRHQVQKLTKAIKGKPEEQSLKLALLKSMKRAAYSNTPVGHFGLAKANYCHFTSPIRRYADLIVHRSLNKLRSRRGEDSAPLHPDRLPTEAGMKEIASHISRTERVAADAERDSQQLKMIQYLEHLLEEDPNHTFEAMITEVRPIGLFVELTDLLVKGMIRKVDLPSSHAYYFDRGRGCFVSGINKGKTMGVADRVEVRLVRIDRGRGFLDFTTVS